MELFTTPLSGLYLLKRSPKGDSRGFIERLFCQKTFSAILANRTIRQINRSFTAAECTVRGLHFQFQPHAEMKIVSCIKGEVFDVAVDLRKDSPTFLHHYSKILSEENMSSLVIPEGFAHGFQTLTNDSEMLYLHTADYQPDEEGALNALDPRLAIEWPRDVTHRSYRDSQHAMIPDNFFGIDAS
jgi:dTDP-4-dehydrorhamnose 3,5-epimerase